ncbi:MAG: hypothetical protein ACI89X_003901 [Planctomycetota bacterium]|jgi:hypothetical protein
MDNASARDGARKAFVECVKPNKLTERAVILAGEFSEC